MKPIILFLFIQFLIIIILFINSNLVLGENSSQGDIIHLENRVSESIKTQENIVYESKNELIKRYSAYVFLVLCILILIYWLLK